METPTKQKDIGLWTLKEFQELPHRGDWDKDIGEFDYLIILPTKEIHDSDYRCMDFVAGNAKDGPICRLSGGSDVIHLDGIGGYGKDWLNKYGTVPSCIPSKGWSIDCLKKSGLLRIFANGKLTAGDALSSFDLWSSDKPR